MICSSYKWRWILSRRKKRDTRETQVDRIEETETPLACTKRELFDKSGIKDADTYFVCDYQGSTDMTVSDDWFPYGGSSLGVLPDLTSDAKAILYTTIPMRRSCKSYISSVSMARKKRHTILFPALRNGSPFHHMQIACWVLSGINTSKK